MRPARFSDREAVLKPRRFVDDNEVTLFAREVREALPNVVEETPIASIRHTAKEVNAVKFEKCEKSLAKDTEEHSSDAVEPC